MLSKPLFENLILSTVTNRFLLDFKCIYLACKSVLVSSLNSYLIWISAFTCCGAQNLKPTSTLVITLSFSLSLSETMSGVWIFEKNGVARLIQNPTRESFEQKEPPLPGTGTATAPGARPRVLVYLPTNQEIHSYSDLEQRLNELGWSRYHNSHRPNLLQFHKSEDSAHLISLPIKFADFKSLHMYDIVVKNPSFFEVREVTRHRM